MADSTVAFNWSCTAHTGLRKEPCTLQRFLISFELRSVHAALYWG